MKRVRFEVAPHGASWKVTRASRHVETYSTQAQAIRRAVADAWAYVDDDFTATATLKIKRRNGTIRDERSYPRSSDPRRSKG